MSGEVGNAAKQQNYIHVWVLRQFFADLQFKANILGGRKDMVELSIEQIFKHIKTNVLFGRPVVQLKKHTKKNTMEIPWRFFVPRSELGGASVLSA